MGKTRDELIKELIDIKTDAVVKRVGLDAYWRNENNYYESCKSQAEYEVDIGAYPPMK